MDSEPSSPLRNNPGFGSQQGGVKQGTVFFYVSYFLMSFLILTSAAYVQTLQLTDAQH